MSKLKYIKRLAQSGKTEHAQREIVAFLREYPDNTRGWLLLASLVQDQKKKFECYQRILKIDPSHTLAARELIALLSDPEQDADDYPAEFQEALEYMKIQKDLSRPQKKGAPLWMKALRDTYRNSGPLGLRFGYPQEDKRRLGPLRPEDAIELLEPLAEDQQTRCPECNAIASVEESICPWCSADLNPA